MPAGLSQRAHRVLSINDQRDRELPRHLGRRARRPAARPPISIARAVRRASEAPPHAARSAARRLEAARAIDEGAFCKRMLATARGANLHCRHRGRGGKPTARAAAPNRALQVGTGGMAGRGGAAECQLDCRSSRIAFSQSTNPKIESFCATFGALGAALPRARRFPLREPSEGPRRRRPAPPEALRGASGWRKPSRGRGLRADGGDRARRKFTLPPPRTRWQTNHTSSCAEPSATCGY